MIYFVVIIGIVILVSFTDFNSHLHKFGAWVEILILSMLAGFRDMGGSDFIIYKSIYYGIITPYFKDEKGYIFLNNLFSWCGFSYNIFLFIYSFASISLLIWFLNKQTKYPSFALLFYIACYFFFYNMVLNRQMLCVSLMLWIIYQWNKNKLISLGLVALGAMFHNSIVVIVPFLLIFEFLKHKNNYYSWYIFFAVLILFTICFTPNQIVDFLNSVVGLSFVGSRLINYLQSSEISTYTLNCIEYLKMIFALFVILPYLRKIMQEKKNRIWIFMYFVGIILLIWTRNIEILFRIFIYFDLSLLVLLPICLDLFSNSFVINRRKIVLVGAYMLMGGLSLFSILYRTYNFCNAEFWQYHFYFL